MAAQVDREHGVPVLRARAFEAATAADTDVAHQPVETLPAVGPFGRSVGHHRRARRLVADIADNDPGRAADAGDHRGRFAHRSFVAVRAHDGRAFHRALHRDRASVADGGVGLGTRLRPCAHHQHATTLEQSFAHGRTVLHPPSGKSFAGTDRDS